MMKTKGLFSIILLFVIVFSPDGLNAQDVLNGVFVKEKTRNRKPVPYQYLREADVMWSVKTCLEGNSAKGKNKSSFVLP